MKLALPMDDVAKPVLHCLECHRRFPVGPYFGRHPDAAPCQAEGCCFEVQYEVPRGSDITSALFPTPLLGPAKLRDRLKLPELWLKNEAALPTGSWKDRVNNIHAQLAVKWGMRRMVAISTGNHGVSLAAQAKAQGLSCHVFIRADAPLFIRQLIRYFGATLSPYTADPMPELRELLHDEAVYPAVSLPPLAGVANPFGAEGYKAIAAELAERISPDRDTWVIVPAGIGDGVFGIWKGFVELQTMGSIGVIPRMVAVQAAGCAPLVDAVERGLDAPVAVSNPGQSIASSILETWSGRHALRAIRQSQGTALAVSDCQILRAMDLLADEGLLIEPASATTLAAAVALAAMGRIARDQTIVCILSGGAMKWAGASWFNREIVAQGVTV